MLTCHNSVGLVGMDHIHWAVHANNQPGAKAPVRALQMALQPLQNEQGCESFASCLPDWRSGFRQVKACCLTQACSTLHAPVVRAISSGQLHRTVQCYHSTRQPCATSFLRRILRPSFNNGVGRVSKLFSAVTFTDGACQTMRMSPL